MATVTGVILDINIEQDNEILITLRLPEGDIIHINYVKEDERIVEALSNALSDGDLVTCRIDGKLDFDQDEPHDGRGSIRQYDFKSAFSDLFDNVFGDSRTDTFTAEEKAAVSMFCDEAAGAIKVRFGANPVQSAVIDGEFKKLASSLQTVGKAEWKKKFIAAMINIGAAFAVDQAVGTTFILTLAEIIKQVIAGLTKRLIAR